MNHTPLFTYQCIGIETPQYNGIFSQITIASEEKVKKLTTGYQPILGHKAVDQAETMRQILKSLAVLVGGDTSEADLANHIDFWMSDRGSEIDSMLKKMNVDERKRTKVNFVSSP